MDEDLDDDYTLTKLSDEEKQRRLGRVLSSIYGRVCSVLIGLCDFEMGYVMYTIGDGRAPHSVPLESLGYKRDSEGEWVNSQPIDGTIEAIPGVPSTKTFARDGSGKLRGIGPLLNVF